MSWRRGNRDQVKNFKKGKSAWDEQGAATEFSADDAVVRKQGDRLVIKPARRRSLLTALATLSPLRENFPAIQGLPADEHSA